MNIDAYIDIDFDSDIDEGFWALFWFFRMYLYHWAGL